MKKIRILLMGAFALFSFSAYAEDVMSFKNETGFMAGVRIQSPKAGVEDFVLINADGTETYPAKKEVYWISGQLITDSKHAVCCEWVQMTAGSSMKILSNDAGTDCSCALNE